MFIHTHEENEADEYRHEADYHTLMRWIRNVAIVFFGGCFIYMIVSCMTN